jgi:hypothetical protein
MRYDWAMLIGAAWSLLGQREGHSSWRVKKTRLRVLPLKHETSQADNI